MTPSGICASSSCLRGCARKCQSGFTLVELLVALTLFGLLSVALLGGLRFGTRAWESAEVASQRINGETAVRGILRRQIAQSEIPTPEKSNESRLNIFSGSEQRLEFTATAPGYVGYGGATDFMLEMAEGDLVLSWRVNRPDGDPERGYDNDLQEESQRRRRLLSDVAELKLRYFGLKERDRQGAWYDAWQEDGLLPSLVEITLAYPEGDRRTWPPLIVSLKKQPLLAEAAR